MTTDPRATTRTFILQPGKKHYGQDEYGRTIRLEAGTEVELTETQAQAFGDRFVLKGAPMSAPAEAPEPAPEPAAAAPEPAPATASPAEELRKVIEGTEEDEPTPTPAAEDQAAAPAEEPARAAPEQPAEPAAAEEPAATPAEPDADVPEEATPGGPGDDPAAFIAKDVLKVVRATDDVAQLEAIQKAEEDGKARDSILSAIDDRLERLAAG